jgi:hypothetical protein
MSTESMSPAELVIANVACPFVGTFGHVEAEVAAGYMVMAMQDQESFAPVRTPQMAEAMTKRKDDDAFRWMHNPFCRPDLDDLVARGFAEWEGEPYKTAIGFTPKGLETLTQCAWRQQAEAPKT